jgi:hypothetical protein
LGHYLKKERKKLLRILETGTKHKKLQELHLLAIFCLEDRLLREGGTIDGLGNAIPYNHLKILL